MDIYIFNLISIFIYLSFFSLLKKTIHVIPNQKDKNIKLLITIGLQLFFISAFRAKDVGIDLQRYIPRYNLIASTEWKDIFSLRHVVDFEYGYILYNKVISTLFKNEQALLIVTSAIVTFSFSYFIWKYSKIPWLSFYLFITLGFWGSSFNILRQYIAMSILMFSIKYIKNRNLLKFLACLCLAISFHTTSIFYIILYPLYNIKINKIHITLLSFIAIVNMFATEYIIKLIVGQTSYSKYFQDIGSGLGHGSGEGNLAILVLVIICVLFFRKLVEDSNSNINLWLNMLIVAAFLNILALDLGIFERVMKYFMIAIIIAIPNTIYSLKQLEMRLIGKTLVIVLTAYYYFAILMTDYLSSSGTIPYIFMWQ
jgi:transmembrane protein EpsG